MAIDDIQVSLKLNDDLSEPVKSATSELEKLKKQLSGTYEKLEGLENTAKKLTGLQELYAKTRDNSEAMVKLKNRLSEAEAEEAKLSQTSEKSLAQTIRSLGIRMKLNTEITNTANKSLVLHHEIKKLKFSLQDADVNSANLSEKQSILAKTITETKKQAQRQSQEINKINYDKNIENIEKVYEAHKKLAAQFINSGKEKIGKGMGIIDEFMSATQSGRQHDADLQEIIYGNGLSKSSTELGTILSVSDAQSRVTEFTKPEIASASAVLSRSGMSNADIEKYSMSFLNYATIKGDTPESATKEIMSTISAANLKKPQINEFLDLITTGFFQGKVSIDNLGESVRQNLSELSELKISLQSSLVMLTMMGKMNVFGPEAGIRIKELHSQLSSTQGVDALEKIGVSAMNADGKLRELPEIVRDLASATESMDPAAKLAAFDSIAGAGQGEQLAQLIEGMNLNGIGSIIEAMQGSQGELARLASEKRDTLGVDLLIFQQSLDGISIALNDIAKGPMQYVVQGMTVLTHAVTDFIQNNQILVGIIMFVIAAFAGIMVISGAALVAIGNLILGYAAMRFAFLKVAAAAQWLFPVLINGLRTVASVLIANPIGLAIAAIAVVVAVVAWLIYDNWEWIKNVLSWSPLEMLAAAWNGIMDFLGLENLKTDVEGIWEAIKTILSWSPLGMLIQGWNGIMGALGLDSLVVDVDAIFAQVKAILSQPPMETIQAAWTNIKSAFSIDTLEEDFQAVWDSLLGILSWSPMETIEGAWKGVTKFFDDLPQTFKGVVDEVTKLIDLVPDLPDIEVPEWFSLSYLFGEDEEGADSQKPALAKAKLAPALAGAGGTVNNNTQSVQITVNAAEGMNEQDVANQVALLIRQQGGLLGMPSGQGQLYDGA